MANPFPARFDDDSGVTRLDGEIVFTDPDNQPGGEPPFKPATGDDLTLLTDSTGAAALISGGDDSAGAALQSLDAASALIVNNTGVLVQANEGGPLGFYGTTPIAKPSIANATAPDLLAALVALGLVTDDT